MKRPELKEVPMAVAGNPESRHGIILAKNELAKKFNIKTAETIWQAKKKCPDLVLVPPSYSDYVSYSKRVNSIYQQYTDLCETFGLDETFLDVTASLKLFGKTGRGIADELRERVKKEIGITISVGVSFNKIFAKLGSDYKKPHGVTQAQFDSCLAWYTAHPQLFDKIYPKVLKELDKEREAFLALHPEYAEVAVTDEGLQVTGDSLPVFTRREMDSVLWVAAHGYVNSWNPLTLPPDTSVHDFIDEFFPQLRISGGGVVDTLETGVGVSEVAHD